jgi:hypothetical protein
MTLQPVQNSVQRAHEGGVGAFLSFFRFEGESTLPLTAPQAHH